MARKRTLTAEWLGVLNIGHNLLPFTGNGEVSIWGEKFWSGTKYPKENQLKAANIHLSWMDYLNDNFYKYFVFDDSSFILFHCGNLVLLFKLCSINYNHGKVLFLMRPRIDYLVSLCGFVFNDLKSFLKLNYIEFYT